MRVCVCFGGWGVRGKLLAQLLQASTKCLMWRFPHQVVYKKARALKILQTPACHRGILKKDGLQIIFARSMAVWVKKATLFFYII